MNDRIIPPARPIAKPNPMLQDHLPKRGMPDVTLTEEERDIAAEADELLADMPELKAPHKLRVRDRNRIMRLVFDSDLMQDGGTISVDSADPDLMMKMLDLIAGVDEFAESIARNPEQYAEWAEGKDYDVFMAIMNRYAESLGK